jgi:hypothetical protein
MSLLNLVKQTTNNGLLKRSLNQVIKRTLVTDTLPISRKHTIYFI